MTGLHIDPDTRSSTPVSVVSPNRGGDSHSIESRLIVLVPNDRINENGLSEALTALTTDSVSEIRFIGLGSDKPNSRLALKLEDLLAKTNTLPVPVFMQIVNEKSWFNAVQLVARSGDQIVCLARLNTGSLVEELRENMSFPVHIIKDTHPTLPSRIGHILGRVIFEIFPLIVVAGFFWLQIRLEVQLEGVINTIAMILTVLVELGLIFIWSLFIK